MSQELLYMLIFVAVGTGFGVVSFTIERILAPSTPGLRKNDPYECGEIIYGQPWIKVHIRYYLFAILFLIFDVETIFLFPWAVVFKDLGLFGLIEMFIFIAILLLGLIWPWRKGVLKWD